jgi:SAM-dependent methyltransferase
MTSPIKRYCELSESHNYISGDRAKAREAIIQKILPNAEMVNVPCPCGNDPAESIPLAYIDRWGLPATMVLCTTCGLIRIDPRWDDNTYARIYEQYFWPLQVGFFDITRERFDLSVRRAALFAQFLKTHIELTGKSLLEIGCSYGAGLTSIKDTGAELTGYDYDERCLGYGRSFTGLNLKLGGIKEAVTEGKQYDVIVLRHVLEHFLNPFEECLLLKSLLKENGTMFVEVPGIFNLKDVGNDPLMYFNVFHTFSFSLINMSHLMNACSFKLTYGDEQILSLWIKAKEEFEVNWPEPNLSKKIRNFLLQMEMEREKTIKSSNRIVNKIFDLLKRIKKPRG